MAWNYTGDKPLSEPKTAQFTKTYVRHITPMKIE